MMRILLLGMPDVASCFDRTMKIPNLGIASLAANVENADCYVIDLVLHPKNVLKTVRSRIDVIKPDIVGLSAMTFQYDTAKEIAKMVKRHYPHIITILGGYHATLAYDLIAEDSGSDVFDYMIKGEGEPVLNSLVHALTNGTDVSEIPGLSYRHGGEFIHNPKGELTELDSLEIPNRQTRLNNKFTYFGKPFDVVETSRGCLKSCSFCSIQSMYGRSYRQYPIERVLEDISDAKANGAKGVFFVDDNINLQPKRLLELCESIVDAGLDDLDYISQADVSGFVAEPKLPEAMKKAGFKGLFLGIESVVEDNHSFLKKQNTLENTRSVITSLRSQGIYVAGGFIVGNPNDDAKAVSGAFQTALKLPLDHAIMWCLTPYPGTSIREYMFSENFITNPYNFSTYNGFICNLRTKHLTERELTSIIAESGRNLYFNPRFFLRSRTWHFTPRNAWVYFRTVSEYISTARKNRLFASRHSL